MMLISIIIKNRRAGHRVTIAYAAESGEKVTQALVRKIFDELPVP